MWYADSMSRRRKREPYEEEYDDPVEQLATRLADKIVGNPQIQNAISRFEGLFDVVGHGIDRAGELVARGSQRHPEIRERIRYRTKVVEKPVEVPIDPRVIFGFPADIKLTKAMVKERKRVLAGLWHPDRGGSTESMQRLNAAAAALLQEIG